MLESQTQALPLPELEPRFMLNLIVACDQNNLIGHQGGMPWHLPRDLRYFRQQTLNQTVILGHRTYQSLGKALPRRRHIVLSRQKRPLPDAHCVQSPAEALRLAQSWPEQAWLIGGAEIYRLFMPWVERLHLTRIHHAFMGDAYFSWDESAWQLQSREDFAADAENPYALSFLIYTRSRP